MPNPPRVRRNSDGMLAGAALAGVGLAINSLARRDRADLVNGVVAASGGGLASLALIAGWSVASVQDQARSLKSAPAGSLARTSTP